MKYLNINKKAVIVFITLLMSLNFSLSFAAIEATDAQGNKYILSDDGTYKKLENKGLSEKEVVSRLVAASKAYTNIMQKKISDEQETCIKEMIEDNAGPSKWQKLNFLNQPWENVSQWVETLPMKDGVVTNELLVVQGQIYILGALEAAKKYCDMN